MSACGRTRLHICDGIDYSPDGIEALREELIGYRDQALQQDAFRPALALTHAVALLAHLKELEELGGD